MDDHAAPEALTNERPFQISLRSLFALTSIVAFLAAAASVGDESFAGAGRPARCYAALIAINAVRYWMRRSRRTGRFADTAFGLLLLIMLPYVYFVVFRDNYGGYSFTGVKWFTEPIVLYAVPTVSFFVFDRPQRQLSPVDFVWLSLAEFVIFPIWVFVFSIVALILGWIRF